MKINQLGSPAGANRSVKRLGRGGASGHGGTSGRGHKGQKARSGGGVRPGFEGGQMPLLRRLPKIGFTPFSQKTYQVINLQVLNRFPAGTTVDHALLERSGLVKKNCPVKVLAGGELKVPLRIEAHSFSRKAAERIAAVGGKAIVTST